MWHTLPADPLISSCTLCHSNISLAPILPRKNQELHLPKQSLITAVARTCIMRVKNSDNPWLTSPHHADLVPIGTHSLWASVSGPIRTPNSPLLIFFTGAGGPSALYIKLQQALSSHIRCLFYDRAGYDRRQEVPHDLQTSRS
jgi:hypothetical protein